AETRSDSFWALEPGYWGQAEVLVKGGRGPLLLKLFDREFTSIRDFVEREPLQALSVGPALIAALNEAGRRAEAEELARRLLGRLDLEVKNGAWATNAAVPRATILATIG